MNKQSFSPVIKALTAAIFIAAVLIRIYYIHYTPTWIRQHDVIGFGTGLGQAAFIEYFYERLRLIDFDPREIWGFFQPPLHHMLAGLWLRLMRFIGNFLGWSMDTCREKVQVLPLIYSMLTAAFGARILRSLKVSGAAFVTGLSLIALHPCLIQMSGSINNDMLCVLLQIMGMYFFLRYMEAESLRSLIAAALCMGLSMMAKLSGIMLAAPIGFIMLIRLIRAIRAKDKVKAITYLKQYLLFGVISIPLGIWSPVRNCIKFGVPLAYTPKVGEPIEGLGVMARLFYTGGENTPFTCMVANGNSYDEFNVPLAILKTSLFGEADFSFCSPLSTPIGWVLLICAALLALAVCLSGSYLAVRREGGEPTAFMIVYIMFSVAFLVRLCFAIPNFSSQDFRYIAHIIVPCAALIAMFTQRSGRWTRLSLSLLAAVFVISSLATYCLAGGVVWN